MAVTFVAQSNSGYASVNDVVVTKPSGLAENDLMIFHLVTNGNNVTPANLSGWTYVGFSAAAGSARVSYCAYKFATSGDVAASDFTWSDIDAGSVGAFGGISVFRGVSQSATLFVQTSNRTTNTGSPSLTGITPSSRGDNLLVQLWNAGSNVSSIASYAIATSNPSWSEAYDVDGGNLVHSCAYAVRPQTTATGNFSCAGGDGTTDWNAWFLSFGPALSTSQSETITHTENYERKISIFPSEEITHTDNLLSEKSRVWTQENKNPTTWTEEIK